MKFKITSIELELVLYCHMLYDNKVSQNMLILKDYFGNLTITSYMRIWIKCRITCFLILDIPYSALFFFPWVFTFISVIPTNYLNRGQKKTSTMCRQFFIIITNTPETNRHRTAFTDQWIKRRTNGLYYELSHYWGSWLWITTSNFVAKVIILISNA